jgi:ABC-type antimicrobial peptide transport system permease subunit
MIIRRGAWSFRPLISVLPFYRVSMLLPWEYGVRNLSRRPARTALTMLALSIVVMLIFLVIGFIRGLEKSLALSGDPNVVLIYSMTSEQNIENSSIGENIPELLHASLGASVVRFGIDHSSPELFIASRIALTNGEAGFGLVRGVTTSTPLVRRSVRLIEGRWPAANEVIVGRLAPAKIGSSKQSLALGEKIEFEGQSWTIVGRFTANGASYESEIWCRLEDFQLATKRQDLSLIALLQPPGSSMAELDMFCKERIDLELVATNEQAYFAALRDFFQPVRSVAWTTVWLVAGAGVFAGLNMMYGAVAGRIREFATLRSIGYRRTAILVSLLQEGLLLAAAACLLAGLIAAFMIDGLAVKFTMGAFRLEIDGTTILMGCAIGLVLGVLGTIPPAIKALRTEVAPGLKAI